MTRPLEVAVSRLYQMFLALLLSTALLPTLAAESEAVTLYFRAAITIGPDGTLARLDWQQAEKIPAVLREKLDARVRSWEFQPGAIDGQPAETETTLRLRLLATPVGGGMAVRIESADTGPAMEGMHPPGYPREALRSGAEAHLLAALTVDADGSHRVVLEGYEGSDRYRETFFDAVRPVLEHVTVRPERVGGHPVAAHFAVPIDFCVGRAACDASPWRQDKGTSLPTTAPGMPKPAGSVARLVTDVRDTTI